MIKYSLKFLKVEVNSVKSEAIISLGCSLSQSLFNLLTKQEIESRSINWHKLNKNYSQRGIELIHHPLDDQMLNFEIKLFELA